MKRFYCTVCKKMKRVRVYPASVATPHATNPTDRVGQCKYHTRAQSVHSVHSVQTNQFTLKTGTR